MNSDEHTHHAASGESTVSTALSVIAIGGIVTAGAVMLAPHVLPALGVGSEEMATRAMMILHESSGIAGAINQGLAAVPLIGSQLAEGGFFTAITTGIIGMGGVLMGDSMAQEKNSESTRGWGKFIKYGALVTSALIALPTVLTAIGSSLIFLAATLTNDMAFASNVVSTVKSTIGTMAGVGHPMLGLSGFAAAIPHFMTCGTALLPAALSVKLWKDDKREEKQPYVARDRHGNPLPESDRNHDMTQEEIALVARYNEAKPVEKILLKQEILAQGYDPDFHDNGTVHLYKHAHHAPSYQSR